MAFQMKNFAPVGNPSAGISSIASGALGVGAPRVFSYVTEDAHATVDDAGYFNGAVAYGGAYNILQKGDIIWVVVCAAGAVSTYGHHVVVDKASGTLDTTNVTVGLMTDTN
jgi:hypothetical protein